MPVRFDPFNRSFVTSPYAHYAELRDHDPVHWSGLLHGWVLTRHDHVAEVLGDPTTSSDIRRATPNPLVELELAGLVDHDRATRTIVHLDDPDHGRVRKLIADPFRVRAVDRLRSLVEERIDATVDRLAVAGGGREAEIDLVAELTYPLPVEIFSTWLGMPEEAAPQFREWTSWVARSRDPLPPHEREQFFTALTAMTDYLEDQAEARRTQPTDDLLSYLVAATDPRPTDDATTPGDNDDGPRLSHDELLSQLITLYMAGHEPTAGLVGNGVLALLQHPDELARLRADPSLVRNAVSELLRYDGPNQFIRRVTTRPIDLDGTAIPAGAVLYVGIASANRDERRWGPDADQVVVDRPDAAQHLQFGAGAHACLGGHFARLQAERMLDAVLGRFHGLELAGTPEWSDRMFIRGLQALPVRATVT